jgi:hypothetical protein
MHSRTVATLRQLEQANWFSCVGNLDTEAAKVLSSWDDAIEHCSTLDWENLCLEAANQYCERLREKSPSRFSQWNKVVDEVKPFAIEMVQRKCRTVVENHGLPKPFRDCVDWDILHLLLEAEFADVFPPGFYASQAFWYLRGHFPCGWDGEFPAGRLVIY